MDKPQRSSPGYFVHLLIATFFGSGFLPAIPGTWGSLFTALLIWFLPSIPWGFEFVILIAIFFLGVRSSTQVERVSQSTDPGYIVIDEFIGMALVLMTVPKSFVLYLFAFLLFRIFDIVKPAPVNQLQDLPEGWGVMVDDVVAGIYAIIVLQLGRLIF